jgi:benzoyl-CoA reductase/2-hydroxyglutaryl-CoA dehydratase subunit BcrC/BadD/HgdB
LNSRKISNQKSRVAGSINKEDTGSLEEYFRESLVSCKKKPHVGWLCTYTPEELINAAGFVPVRILGSKKFERSGSYFPINFCPYLKSTWESLLERNQSLEGIIFTNSCDGMRRLYDTAVKYLPDTPSFMLDVPHLTGSRQIVFFASNIGRLKLFLEKLSGRKISGSQIKNSVSLINKKRSLLGKLGKMFYQSQGNIGIGVYFRILQIAMTCDPEVFTRELEVYLNMVNSYTGTDTADIPSKKEKKGPAVMLMGNFITENRLWDMLSGLNLHVVAEDLCVSNRYFEKEIDTDPPLDIIESISKRYLYKPVCMRMADLGHKLKEVEEKAVGQKVKGLIFISLKFCDTMLYSFPLIKQRLLELKIPVLYLEIEYNNFSEGQLKTRVQAFLEML